MTKYKEYSFYQLSVDVQRQMILDLIHKTPYKKA